MNETIQLAKFVSDTGFNDFPAEAINKVKILILDNLASGYVGSTTQWTSMVAKVALSDGLSGPCSVFNRKDGFNTSYASLVNGISIGGFETDHAYVPGSCHPGVAVFPAAFSISEKFKLSGLQFLTSIILGYEVCCRVGWAATRSVEDEKGFHGPGTNASFGSSSAVAKLLGLDSVSTTNSLGIAGSHAGGLLEFKTEGNMTKRIHVARGSQMGLESALLAANGFTGPSRVLEGNNGFLNVYSGNSYPERLTHLLGSEYIFYDTTIKAYACHVSFHPVIDSLHQWKVGKTLCDPSLIKVRVITTQGMIERHGQRSPDTILGAQYSLPFSVALALCTDISDPSIFCEENLWDPNIRKVAQTIQLESDDAFIGNNKDIKAIIHINSDQYSADLEARDWMGSPNKPYSYEQMAKKFFAYASPYLSNSKMDELISSVEYLENVADMSLVGDMIRGTL